MLDGDVAVFLAPNGALKIIGDELNNTVTIATTADGRITVTPGGTTTVNGAFGSFGISSSDVERIIRMKINMHDGDGTVTINTTASDVENLERVNINFDLGTNTLNITGLDTGDRMFITSHSTNTMNIVDVNPGRKLAIITDLHTDLITIDTVTAQRRIVINSLGGADVFTLNDVLVPRVRIDGDDDGVVHINGLTERDAKFDIDGVIIHNSAPRVTNSIALSTLVIDDLSPNGTTIKLLDGTTSATVVAVDDDDNNINFVITGGNPFGVFAVDQSGNLWLFNTESLGDVGTVHNVQITLSDWNTSIVQSVVITVVD